ncbi:coiled-coil domain-containing protein [Planctomicrobium piriforme]|uniref:Uncharacterized protein n=1 Tax=Planctomicrobium piriforme TaxID=1576369 RepID=A0A1I3Q1Z7_9PLAN|nr:hypothetical protein [Planctomicrobium piriforme]SFJ27642.1 hypothetical protein SAMN05421753_117111 [Planctomicrobium piriforme]
MPTPALRRDPLHREQLNQPAVEDAPEDQLSQAARFVTHLQLQLAELDRREQQLNAQLGTLQEQQRATRLAARQLEEQTAHLREELESRAALIAEGERALDLREESLAKQAADLRLQRQSLDQAREAFEQSRLKEHRESLQQLETERAALQIERETLTGDHQSLRDALQLELIQEREALAQAQAEFAEQERRLREELQSEQAALQATAEQARLEFEALKEQELQNLSRLAQEQREQIELERIAILSAAEQQSGDILQERAELQTLRDEQAKLNQQWAEHRKSERRQHLEELEELSRDRLGKLDQREVELERREIDLQKRFRLHEDHLNNARRELATHRSTIAVEQQQHRNWVEQVEQSVRMRLGQMRRFRDLLTQREHSLAEEQELFVQQRREVEGQLALQREGLVSERQQFMEMRERERQLLDEHQQRLNDEAGLLTATRGRLDTFSEQLGPLLESLIQPPFPAAEGETPPVDRQQPLEDLLTLLSQQRAEFDLARKQFADLDRTRRQEESAFIHWIEIREASMREREANFQGQLEELIIREQACQAEREQWQRERIEVEQVIRNLVQQIEQAQQVA